MLNVQQLFATDHDAVVTLQSPFTDSFFPSLYKTIQTSLLKPIIFVGGAALGASVIDSANDWMAVQKADCGGLSDGVSLLVYTLGSSAVASL